MDDTTTIGALRRLVQDFQHARGWTEQQSPKNVAMSIAIEAAELMEHFQWLELEESDDYARDAATRSEVAAELADVLIYCLCFANRTGIDLSQAVRSKMARNAERWPISVTLPGFGSEGNEESA